ncbi:MAG: glycerol-3-phosphate dehydrogenase [Cytophagaceae bacterium]|jgi:glycerol-3-phosphate dehydrogenase|nr:glycerol-3-phosphate dehydrogenase [Cytophagaceae bacterium]
MLDSIFSREQSFVKATEQEWDVIIIGGGATGCGAALDAVSRGLKTLLVEKADFASGTSGRSTKLIHGGLRYLKNMEFALVREVGLERAILQRNARHLVYRDPMFLPVYKGGELGWTTTALALWVYEWLAGVESSERRVMLSVKDTLAQLPLLQTKGLLGSAKYFEYRTDDARLTLALALSARHKGATLLNYAKVEEFIYEAQQLKGVVVKDEAGAASYRLRARCFVNAAGPWVDRISSLDKTTVHQPKLAGSRGIHIVLSSFDFPLKQAVYFDAPDGRMVFAIPREQMVYVGTTDVFYKGSLEDPEIPVKEMEYLLSCVRDKFQLKNITLSQIHSAWSGVRPLVMEQGKAEGKISRKDELYTSKSGLITITGGKLTGYRKMAQRAMDAVCKQLQYNGSSRTIQLPLWGGNFPSDEAFGYFVSIKIVEVMEALNILSYEAELLVRRYGDHTDAFLAYIPKANYYAQKYQASLSLTLQIVYAIAVEQALKPEDVYIRRTTDFYFRTVDLKQNYKKLIAIMADCLSQDEAWIKAEETVFLAHVQNLRLD